MVLGGLTKHGFRGDVWLSTSRGLMWKDVIIVPFRADTFMAVRLLVGIPSLSWVASSSSDSSLSDVHRSDDFGLSWTRITTRAGWSNRYRFGTAVFVASNTVTASAAASAGEGLGGTKSLSLGASPHTDDLWRLQLRKFCTPTLTLGPLTMEFIGPSRCGMRRS